jgi:8-amino-7-oxononanoate synthase
MAAYTVMQKSKNTQTLRNNIASFNKSSLNTTNKIRSFSAIHCFLVPGNEHATRAANGLRKKGFDVRAIKSPTVKEGSERLRVCLHAFNTPTEVSKLAAALHDVFV